MTEFKREITITHPVVVNDRKPFDARTMNLSFHISDLDIYISDYDDAKNDFNFHQSFRFNTLQELEAVKYLLQWQLANALNPPIEVTKKVLDAMEKVPEAKFRVLEAGLLPKLFRKAIGCETKKEGGCNWVYGKTFYYDSWVDGIEKKLGIGDYIQADCPLALQVLLQFNTEGELFDA
jgi:hypothetical protein